MKTKIRNIIIIASALYLLACCYNVDFESSYADGGARVVSAINYISPEVNRLTNHTFIY